MTSHNTNHCCTRNGQAVKISAQNVLVVAAFEICSPSMATGPYGHESDQAGKRRKLPRAVGIAVALASPLLVVDLVLVFVFIAVTTAQRIAAAAALTSAACALINTALAIAKARKPDTELPKPLDHIVPKQDVTIRANLALACALLVLSPLCGWWYVNNHPIDVTGKASLGYGGRCQPIPGADPSRISASIATDGSGIGSNSPCSIRLKLSASGIHRFGGNFTFTIDTPSVDPSAGVDCRSTTRLSFPASDGLVGSLSQISSGQSASAQIAGGAAEIDVQVTVFTTDGTRCPVYLDLQNVALIGNWWW
jgi:hypothetical protein